MNKWIVITTINEKTEAIRRFEAFSDWNMVVVGDRKSKPIASTDRLTFLSVEDQLKLGFSFVDLCPYNHYSRKNIGYLYAMQQGAEVIFDTDDDNSPYDRWSLQDFSCNQVLASKKYINVYKYFTDAHIWPRGLPLDEIHSQQPEEESSAASLRVGVWQGLADLDPDVDAIYRLTVNKEVTFDRRDSVVLSEGSYCPFNSQNTFWNSKAFPLLYLPSTTSFRFTDILRGYVAQPLLWKQSLHLGFSDASVYQERNQHDLMKDFKDEIECYMNVKGIVGVMEGLDLHDGPIDGIKQIYAALDANGFVKAEEVRMLDAWLSDAQRVLGS